MECKIRGFDRDKDQFKKLAYGLLYTTTPEAYENSLQLFEVFATDAKMKDWFSGGMSKRRKSFMLLHVLTPCKAI